MSNRSSLKRFRPSIDRCEPRSLASVGLTSLAGPGPLAAAHHDLAREPQAQGTYGFLRFVNDTKRAENFQISGPISVTKELAARGGSVVYFWTAPNNVSSLEFTIRFENTKGLYSTEGPPTFHRQAKSWTGNLPSGRALDELIAKHSHTYTFKETNGFTNLDGKPV